MKTIPRETVADALGTSPDALPPGDLPVDRLALRLFAFLRATEEDDEIETPPDLWCAALQTHLAETDPTCALTVVQAMMPLAQDPEDLALIAAGPLDELLTVESILLLDALVQAAASPRFAYALSGAPMEGMPALFRARIRALCPTGSPGDGDPLPPV